MTRPAVVHTANILTSRLSDALDVPGGQFVINPRLGCDQRTGYAVPAYSDRDVLIQDRVTPADISDYVYRNSDLLTRPGAVFGGWRCPWSGLAHLVTATVRYDRAEAREFARTLSASVWDLSHGVSIAA